MRIAKKLTVFDVTNLVVGAIVGADIYIAASFGSGLLGPASLLAWMVAGIFATIIALTFARCSGTVKQVGGPYAYVKKAFGHFPGFMAGWSVWLAEVAALCVFPLAFVTYLSYIFPMDFFGRTLIIFLFVTFLFVTNYFGIKSAARTNDLLTISKLAPLLVFIAAGIFWMYANPATVIKNLFPFAPLGFGDFGQALVLIFWAYVGFELATMPSSEIKNPEKSISKAIIYGMAIVSVFYLLTNLVITASVDYNVLAEQSAPLTYVSTIFFGVIGAAIMTIGALVSVSGSDESGLIGTVRLAYAMAADGYFPKALTKRHNRYNTPHVSLAVHCAIAFLVAAFLPVTSLIIFSVFCLAFCFVMVALAAMKLRKDSITKALSVSSILISLYLMSQSSALTIAAGTGLLLVGIPVYTFFSPKSEIKEAQRFLFRRENVLRRRMRREHVFLAYLVRRALRLHATKQ